MFNKSALFLVNKVFDENYAFHKCFGWIFQIIYTPTLPWAHPQPLDPARLFRSVLFMARIFFFSYESSSIETWSKHLVCRSSSSFFVNCLAFGICCINLALKNMSIIKKDAIFELKKKKRERG